MRRVTGFRTRLIAGFAAVIVLLGVGMALAVERMRAVSRAQIASLQESTREIAIAERLRWSGELVVSAGRGYLLAGDRELLDEIDRATEELARDVAALHADDLSPRARQLVDEAEAVANRFIAAQQQLVSAKQDAQPQAELVARVRTELIGLRQQLGEALDRLVAQEDAEIRQSYDQARSERAALAGSLYVMIGVLIVASLAIAILFANQASRAFHHERDAHDVAREAVARRDEVIGIVAHDLRNPLAAIAMKAAVAETMTPSPELRARIESIENVTMRMEYLVRTMLDVVDIESGRFELDRTPCQVRPIVDTTLGLFEDVALAKHVALDAAIASPLPAVDADRDRVIQVLTNLVGNALRVTPQHGRITIAAHAADGSVRIDVTDTGPGIAAEDVPHVFERYWKGTAPGYKGMGLSLYLSQRVIEAHGGRLRVESEPNRRTTFSFTLPVAEA